MNDLQSSFMWTAFYARFANKLLQFKDKRSELLVIVKRAFDELGMKYPFIDKGEPLDDVCPFTVFGCFNKGITTENRIVIMTAIGKKFGMQIEAPTEFDGVPVLNNMNSWFFKNKNVRQPEDISNLWSMFETGINYADNPSEVTKEKLIESYDKVKKQKGVLWNLTMGLYWIRPYSYLNLDEKNRDYLLHDKDFSTKILTLSNLKQLPDARTYLHLVELCQTIFARNDSEVKSFPKLSYNAWTSSISNEKQSSSGRNGDEKRYWLYAPGPKSSKWEEFYAQGIMAMGPDGIGNLKQYPSKNAITVAMKKLYNDDSSHKNDVHACWQFANEIRPDDIVYAKNGLYKIIGRGIVESDYIYEEERAEYRHAHKVKWTNNNGEWEHPGQASLKTLTDITSYTEYVQKLESLFGEEVGGTETKYPSYSKDDFLNEVFMDFEQYETLVNLLKSKKNIILQGAPGVGKTFTAKRLAYSIMGVKDTSRVMMVQFHQSYSYEDFIMGFRPTKDGFELSPGPFYEFCKKAQDDDERDYFFIIDEINRGNLSKIFGELLMLTETDKRGEKLRLLYSNELFSVPGNVYIIGMMNTADRSLALIDYALRRRFAFFELEPAFDSEGFKAMMEAACNPKFDALVGQLKELNTFISKDESLGDGFRIGHSYLCTNTIVTDEWVVFVIKYELLPLIKEYWFDEPAKVEQWKSRLCGVLND
jgi:5-methylcytosine-specific restriction protein B